MRLRSRRLQLYGLQKKLIIVFLVLVMLPLTGIGLYDRFFTNHALVPQVQQRLAREVQLQANQIVNILEAAHGDAIFLGNLRSMRMLRSLDEQPPDPESLLTWRSEAAQDFLVFSATHPGYYRLQYLDAQGREIVRVDFDAGSAQIAPLQALQNRQDAAYFNATMALAPGEVFISSLDLEPRQADDQIQYIPVIRYGLKLDANDGVLVLSLHAVYVLGGLIADQTQQSSWAVFDQDGYFLLYSERHREAAGDTAALDQRRRVQAIYPQAEPLLQGGAGIYETASNTLVYNTIYPTKTQPDRFWVIFYDAPTDVLFAEINHFHQTVLIFLIGTFITALALAMFASDRIVTPISALKRRVEAFGRDGIVPPLPEHIPQDEIGALNRAFHQMAQELDKKRQQQRMLIDQLITAQEEERKLVAYDLHDGLIQQMVGARFHLTSYRQQCEPGACADMESFQRGYDALTEAIAEGRRIIEGLRPAILDDLGLVAALEEVAQSTAQVAGWQLDQHFEHLSAEPDKLVSATLYRIAQEAFNNIRKHASATRVSMRLSNTDGISLTIKDNGSGFNPLMPERSRGMGITTMRERANLVDGHCTISSVPGVGTTVEVWVPCEPEERLP